MAARPRTTRRSTPVEKTEKEKSKAKDRESELPLVPVASENSKRPRLEVEASAVTTTSPSPLSVVRLNVGGTRFETTLMTLTLVKGNYFEALFSRWEPRKEEDGSVFIDRDPAKDLYLLEREAEFYHLDLLCGLITRERERRAGPIERFRPPPEKTRFYCLDSTGLIAKKLHKDKVWNATVLGTLELRRGVHEWTVQISPDTPQDLMIGVTPVGADPSCVENCVTSGWYFYPRSTADGGELWSGQEPKHTGTKWPTNGSYFWAKNMTIGMRLDFGAKTLSYCWEGKPWELAYPEINTVWPLCFCVIMAHPGKMVSLLSYREVSPAPRERDQL